MDINNNISEFDIFDNDMELLINEFCEKYNIQDMSKETQNRWNACLSFIYNRLFKNTNTLKYNPNINNEYNQEYIYNNILPVYIDYCNLYGKEISLNGFIKLTGIEYNTMLLWREKSSYFGIQIYEKLIQENENSNSDLLANCKNPVGIMARLNHLHNWNMPGVKSSNEQRMTVSLLPTFDNSTQMELCENNTQFTPSNQENT